MGWLAGGVIYSAAYLAIGWLLRGQGQALLWFRICALLIPPLAGVVVIVRRRHVWTGCHWLFWATITLGLMMSAIGLVGWTVDEFLLGRETSWLGWYTVFVLFAAVAPLFGLMAQPHRGSREAVTATTAVDIAGIAVMTGFLYSRFVIGPDLTPVSAQRAPLSLILLSEFQQLIVVVGMVVAAFVARDTRWGATYRRLAIGLIVNAIILTIANLGIWQGLYRSGFVYDVIWIMPYAFYPWAASRAPTSAEVALETERHALTPSRPWVVFSALCLIPLFDYGLRQALPLGPLEGFRDLSTAITILSVLPLLMARLAVEHGEGQQADRKRRLLAAATEQADELISIIRPNGAMEHANDAFCRALGYQPGEVVQMAAADFLAEQVRSQVSTIAEDVRTNGVWRGTLVRCRRDGSTFLTSCTVTSLADDAGRVTQLVGVERDMTAQKVAEAALIESERAYRSTFDGAPAGIAHVSLDGRWLRVNRRLCEILGYTQEELLSLDLFGLVHPEERQEETDAIKRLADGTLERYQRERRLRRRDGSYVWTSLKVTVHRDEAGAAKYVIPIIDDITERKTLEATLRQAQKMDAVGQLAGGVAHDFNNLLTVIIGFSELLLANDSVEGAVRRDLVEIMKTARSAASLTKQLLAFSRRQTLEPRILDLNEVVAGMEDMLRRLLGERVTFATELSTDLGRVTADKTQIEQVVLNLAVNARDAMPAGGTLRIATSNVELDPAFVASHPGAKLGTYVRIAVSDTGTGIDPAVQAHMFEPFYTTKARGHGTGLGLATVYGIVKQSTGYIDAETELGRGSTFSVYLPRTGDVAVTPQVESSRLTFRGTETILLVEDQPDVRRIAREVLVRHGYTVLEACDGTAALDQAAQHNGFIHLLLTDVVMPGLDGRELARRITAQSVGIRILYMSGYADALVGDDGVLEPGLALLRKPFTPARLMQKVRDVLDARESVRT